MSIFGKKLGTQVASTIGTNVIGRAIGRFIPVVGWGLTVYDFGSFLYNHKAEIKEGMEARDNYIQQGLMPIR